jgi:hypothetical protein
VGLALAHAKEGEEKGGAWYGTAPRDRRRGVHQSTKTRPRWARAVHGASRGGMGRRQVGPRHYVVF